MVYASCRSHFRAALSNIRPYAQSRHSLAVLNASPRWFATSSRAQSHIGGAPLSIPPNVTFKVLEPAAKTGRMAPGASTPSVEIEGPLGKLVMAIPSFVHIQQEPTLKKAIVSVADRQKRHQRAMWGTTRAYLQNHIVGVSEGHNTILRLNGVGYRATVEDQAITKTPEYPGQKFVSLKVGYSHPIELGVPQGVKASTPQPTRILLEGVEKEVINSFAAKIRKWRPPEPYKGKGIFVNDETIKLKNKKIK